MYGLAAPMKNTQITRLKKLFELSLTLSGDPMEIFQHAAKMIGKLLEVKIVCLSEIQGEQLNFLAVYMDGEIYSNAGSCLLAITPCATVEQSKDISEHIDNEADKGTQSPLSLRERARVRAVQMSLYQLRLL